jgi:FAD synthetase
MSIADDDTALRIRKYIDMVENVLNQLDESRVNDVEAKKIVSLAKNYLYDSKYYFGIKDYITALSCISYAEGLIDALGMLGHVQVKWKRSEPRRVLVGGTFDLIHPGHIEFLKEASKNGLVYAIVARDGNVLKIKGKRPILSEVDRLKVVSSIKYVYKAFLGDREDFMVPIKKLKPDIIYLGPDQAVDENLILRRAEYEGLHLRVERMPARVNDEKYSTTHIVNEILKRYCSQYK